MRDPRPERDLVAIGVDTGGTFTDVVGYAPADGRLEALKVSSTPAEPARAVLEGIGRLLERLGRGPAAVAALAHGTTVATNAVLEGKWARTALLTTRGFRDVLEIGRQTRPALYDLFTRRPEPIVPRDLRLEVPERLDPAGRVLVPLDEAAVADLAPRLAEAGVESVAVVFLFSYVNPAHERRAREVLARALRRCGASVEKIVLSCETLPAFREYERCATTVLNAALIPRVRRYLLGLQAGTARLGIEKPWRILQSNGGLTSAAWAAERPVTLVLSGPAGGVEGARLVGEQTGHRDLIALDMGGTSCDVSLVHAGRARWRAEGEIAGRPVSVPMLDIHTIGAGGGSLAWVDAGGALRVGPASAGAEPGPACYGRGGDRPTVTDAHLVLGRFDPERPLGDIPRLDLGRAREAIRRGVAEPLGLSVEEAAAGILTVAEAHMVRAVRLISVERGHDPRRFALLAFGGAGPLHAASLARRLGIRTVILPRGAGVLSALGLLGADGVHHFVRTVMQAEGAFELRALRAVLKAFEREARERLHAEGFRSIALEASADLRYRGQSHELNVALRLPLDAASLQELIERFHAGHRRAYGYAAQEPVELVNVRLRAVGQSAPLVLPERRGTPRPQPRGRRRVFLAGDWYDCPWYDSEELAYPACWVGPAVVVSAASTALVLPGQRARVHPQGHLILEENA